MMLPIVSEDIINSIREQTIRASGGQENFYIENLLEEMEKDGNDALLDAIHSTAEAIAAHAIEKIVAEPSDNEDDWNSVDMERAVLAQRVSVFIFSNIVSTSAAVYHALKQQAICDSL